MVNFKYTLKDRGWATIHAAFDATRMEFEVSYMSQALTDFVTSVLTLLAGETVARFALIDEPGEHCWVMRREGATLCVVIVHLDDMYLTEAFIEKRIPGQLPPEKEGEAVATFSCPLIDFAQAVARMVQEIDATYAPSDFVRTRNPGLPIHLIARLMEFVH